MISSTRDKDYYSQPLHIHEQKQPATLSADAAHLDFLHIDKP